MINLLHKLPKSLTIAVSGGSDSMSVLNFLSRKHDVSVIFVNHNTAHSQEAEQFVGDYCVSKGITFSHKTIASDKPSGESWEEFWRNQRYAFFHSIEGLVVTGHNLNDCVEQYIFSSLHGNGRVIPYANKNVVRPVLSNTKSSLREWCVRKDVPWIEDPSNDDTKYMRNLIRHELMPIALKINPGIEKVVKKLVLNNNILS